MRAQATPGLSVSSVRLGGLDLGRGWSLVDLDDARVRDTLVSYVGSHVRLHPDDLSELESYGLALVGGRLVAAPESEPEPEGTESEPESEPEPEGTEPENDTPKRSSRRRRRD